MKRWFSSVIVVFLFATMGRTQTVYSNLFVVNGLGESVSRIDVSEDRVWNNVFTTDNVPQQAKIQGDSLYILNSISSTLQIIDLSSAKEVKKIDLGTQKNPWDFTFCKSAGKIFVSNLMANSVSVVDVASGAVVDSIAVGRSPEGILAANGKVYVTNTAYNASSYSYGQGTVYVIDAGTRTVVDSILTPTNPQNIVIGPNGRLHVVCTGNYGNVPGVVVVVNPGTNSMEDTIAVGGTPSSITITSGGMAYLGAGGWMDYGHVLKYNAANGTVIRSDDHPILTGKGAMGVLADDAGHVFVAAFSDDQVDVIDTSVDSVVLRYNVGDGPQNLALWKTTVSSINEDDLAQGAPVQFRLEQNYPNPVRARAIGSNETQFVFQVPEEETISLKIYNLLGQEVLSLFQGKMSAGQHVFKADLAGLHTGLYFYQLRTNTGILTKKLIVAP